MIINVRDSAIVLVLTKTEAASLKKRLAVEGFQVRKNKSVIKVEEKLAAAMGDI